MRERVWLLPALVAAVLAGLWLLFAPPTPDLAAQVYRTGLFEHHGFTLFNVQWYGGHHTPGYSLIFPPLGALIGPRVVGALAAVVSAALFAQLAHDHFGERARIGAYWFAAATATDLLIGRLTFALGVAFALGAALALFHGRTKTAVLLAAGTTAASPVAGLFLAMGGVAHALAGVRSRRSGGVVAAGAFAPAAALAVAFPEGGSQPFGFWAFAAVVAAAVAVFQLLPGTERTLRTGALLYAGATVAAFAIATPMGSNATRVAAMFAGPILVCALVGRMRPRLLVLAVLPLLVYQWWGPVREVRKDDPSSQLAFYRPLLDFLEPRADASTRVEIPFTRMHWESVHVARRYPLARGWEAQLDVKYNPLFRKAGQLTSERYQHWLGANSVRYVALPDVPLDPASRQEAKIIKRGLPFLRLVYHDKHWQVYEVEGHRGLTHTGSGAWIRRIGPTSFTLQASRSGPVLVRVRWTPYWHVASGSACVERAGDDWTVVDAKRPGTIRIATRFDPRRIVAHGRACSDGGDRR